MKKIYIIPTTHREYKNYNRNHISEILSRLKPDAIFQELPSNWEIMLNNDNQEEKAISMYLKKNKSKIYNVDLPYRNEIAINMGLLNFEDRIQNIINESSDKLIINYRNLCNKIYEPEEKISFKYVTSRVFKKSIIRKEKILESFIKKNSDLELIELYKYSKYFHNNIREETIACNIIMNMQNYNVGVLLIGAEHIEIGRKLLNKRQNIKINF